METEPGAVYIWQDILQSPGFNKLDYRKQIEYADNFFKNVMSKDEIYRNLESDDLREKFYADYMKTIKPKSSIMQEFKEGWKKGVMGYGQKVDWNAPEAATFKGRVASMAGTLVSDLPAMVAGGIAGSRIPFGGPMGAALAAPEAIRASRFSADIGMELPEALKHIGKRAGWGYAAGTALAMGGKGVSALVGKAGGGAAMRTVGSIVGELGGLQGVSLLETGQVWSAEDLAMNVMLLGSLRMARKPVDFLKHIEHSNLFKGKQARIDKAMADAKSGDPAAVQRLNAVLQQEGVPWTGEHIQNVAKSYAALNEILNKDAKLRNDFLREAQETIVRKAYSNKQFLEYSDGFPKGTDPKVILDKFIKGEKSPTEIAREQKPVQEREAAQEKALAEEKARQEQVKQQEQKSQVKPELKAEGQLQQKRAEELKAKEQLQQKKAAELPEKVRESAKQKEIKQQAAKEKATKAVSPKPAPKPEGIPDVFMRMPLEELRKQADLGVRMAQEALKARATAGGKPVVGKPPEPKIEAGADIVSRVDNAINQRARSNILVEVGREAFPEIRLQEAEEAGQWAYAVAKGEATQKQFDVWKGQMWKEGRARGPVRAAKSIAEVKPPEVKKPKVKKPEVKKAEAKATPKEQKQFLLDAVDEAIQEKEPGKTVTIKVPDDGTFRIPNTKANLEAFRKKAARIPTGTPGPGKVIKPSSSPPTKRHEFGDVEYYRDYRPRKQALVEGDKNYYSEGFFTDGKYAVKAKRPSGIKLEKSELEVGKFFPTDATIEARIVGEFAEGRGDRVHVKGKDGRDIILNPKYVDSMLTQHPEAKPFLSESAKEMVVFKVGKEQVGVVASIRESVPTGLAREAAGKPKSDAGVYLSSLGAGQAHKTAVALARAVSSKTAEIRKKYTMPQEIKHGLKKSLDAMVEHDRNLRNVEFMAKEFTKVVNDSVPSKERQMLLVHAYEQKFAPKWMNQLTAQEREILKWATTEKQKLNQYVEDNKLLERMKEKDVNHLYHWWINPKSGEPYKGYYGKFSKGLPQSQQRKIITYESGIEKGLKPASANIGEIIGTEWIAVTRAHNARLLIKTLHETGGDPATMMPRTKGGKPKSIRMIERWDLLEREGFTDDYVRYDNHIINKSTGISGKDGVVAIIDMPVGIRKELHPYVRAYLENPTYGALSQLNFTVKSIKLTSLFHVMSLAQQEIANFRMPLKHIPRGHRLAKELGPELKVLHGEGLKVFEGYEDVGMQNKFFDNATALGKAGNVVLKPVEWMRDFIFGYVHPGMKTSFSVDMFRKMLPEYLKKYSPGVQVEQVYEMISQNKPLPKGALKCARDVVVKADGHFSSEHYKRSLLETNRLMVNMYFSPEARKFWQFALLSPTWQRSHLRIAKNVMKSFMPDKMIEALGMAELGPIKSQYRKYMLGGIMVLGITDLYNQMTTYVMDGERKHIWENPKGNKFSVRAPFNRPDSYYYNKDGEKKMRHGGAVYINPIKSLFEVAGWGTDTIKKAGNKLSPMASSLARLLIGAGPMLNESNWDKTKKFLHDMLMPIAADKLVQSNIIGFDGIRPKLNPEEERKMTWFEALSGTFGIPTHKLKDSRNIDVYIGKYMAARTPSEKNHISTKIDSIFEQVVDEFTGTTADQRDFEQYEKIREYIENTPSPDLRKSMIRKFEIEMQLRLLNKKQRDFYRAALKKPPEARARMAFERWQKMTPKEEAQERGVIDKFAAGVESKNPFWTSKTKEVYMQLYEESL